MLGTNTDIMSQEKNYTDPCPELTGDTEDTLESLTQEELQILADSLEESLEAVTGDPMPSTELSQGDYIITALSLALKSLLANQDAEGNPVNEGVTVLMPTGDFIVVARHAVTDNIIIKTIPAEVMEVPEVGVRVTVSLNEEEEQSITSQPEGVVTEGE